MRRRIQFVVGTAGAIAAALLLFPRWYAAHDPWKEERALSDANHARQMEAWRAYSETPWRRLSEVDGKLQNAAQIVRRTMAAEWLKEEDYRARIFRWPESESFDFTLRHVNEFALEREGKTQDVLGDPCGKCRTISYDPKTNSVSRLFRVQ
jgi:hypothetical protein